jgi:hypothetical protein
MEDSTVKKLLLALPLLFGAAAPAYATGGMACTTSGPNPVEIHLVFGRAAGAPLISAQLIDGGVEVATDKPQWWLDASELRLLLIDPNAEREELLLKAKARGDVYVGTVRRGTRTLRVRCEESG